jgi:hypothetical protein
VLNTNHCISKDIVGKPFDVFALEKLEITKKKRNGKRFNRKLACMLVKNFIYEER